MLDRKHNGQLRSYEVLEVLHRSSFFIGNLRCIGFRRQRENAVADACRRRPLTS